MNVETTFDTFNVGKREKQPNFSWIVHSITLETSNQLFYTKYLFKNNTAFFKYLRAESCALFP